VFLIAAEARISTAAKYWDSEPDTADAGALPMGSVAPAMPPSPASPMKTTHATSTMKPAATAAGFTCPMHSSVKQPGPGKCPICGMDLVPISGGSTP